MVDNLVKRLNKKGWEKEHIYDAVESIYKSKENRSQSTRLMDSLMYWFMLGLVIVINFAVSIALIPFLLGLDGLTLYLIIITLGIIFGLLLEHVIRSIEHLGPRHHLVIAMIIPAVAAINAFITTNVTNKFENILQIGKLHNPFTISVVYAAALVLPFLVSRFVLKKGYYSEELEY